MSMFTAWILFPVVLALLCAGAGLLVDLLAGRRLPGALILPVGLAGLIVVGEFTTATAATAKLTVPALLFLAVLGAGLSLPWRFGRPDPWLAAAALAVFCVFAAPVVLSGSPTFAGYIKLDDTATWFALTDRVMEHGHSIAGLEPSTYRATLEFNLAGGYPVGTFIPFGAVQKLVKGDLAWVFQPYVAFLATMLALPLWEILAGMLPSRRLRALAVFVAAQPALLFGYSLWGGVKEVAAAGGVALVAALAPAVVRAGARWRDVVPLAIAAGSLAAQLSVGGLAWIGPTMLALAAIAVHRFGWRRALGLALPFAVMLGAFAIPAVTEGLLPPSAEPLTDPNSLGNLVAPLNPVQLLGIWPAGDFRFHPEPTIATAVLVALGIAAAAIGLWLAWRRRSVALLLYVTSLLACAAIVLVGSPWNGGKALATASPIVLSLAIAGAASVLRLDRFTGAVLIAVVAGGVIWSNVLAYGGASLAPYGQLAELEQIGEGFAGQGPALMTEYNPYGARHFLRDLDAEGASELRVREVPLASGGVVEKGQPVDTDELDLSGFFEYRTLVLRRSPLRSRPPLPYRLVWSGRYYEVWQRPASFAGPLPEHLALGNGNDPSAVPGCGEVGGLGQLALLHQMQNVQLVGARHAPVYDATEDVLKVPRADRYAAWLLGSVRGSVELWVDGREVAEARQQLQNDGGFIELGEPRLSAGTHEVELRFGGADLHPGSGGFPRPATGPLLFSPAGDAAGELVSVPVAESQRLCGKAWDWVEALSAEP
ncbi:MAG: hypothetical protein QOF85_1206 [Solirubrobacterales bacterium]|jgi:hypothetical protein|nr:hypothetical protein [Solirubrobacterales bacterium]